MAVWTESAAVQSAADRGALISQEHRTASRLERLNFQLPPFLRTAWVSDQARDIYQERYPRIAWAWQECEWHSARNVRPCALISIPTKEHAHWSERFSGARLHSLALRIIETLGTSTDAPSLSTQVVVGSNRDVRAFRNAWITSNHDQMGGLLGYPVCCRTFFSAVAIAENFTDPMWIAALATPAVERLELTLTVSGYWQLNVMLRRLAMRAIPHLPCSFRCEASLALSKSLLAQPTAAEFSEELGWLSQMLDWPLSWSALHGVAEIRTPVLKIATNTDATGRTHILHWRGGSSPPETARGLQFPYRKLLEFKTVP
jgi:hypothetical protein